ncbi:MAG: hypothetical protein QUS33_07115 [Dehalococcoidia bacterium]|nr:hypothetical protein [Dehalococcoidia bacterium]
MAGEADHSERGAGRVASQPVTRKRLSTIAGTIDIVLGTFSAVWITLILLVQDSVFGELPAFVLIVELAVVAMALFAVAGGVFALRRKHWGLALAGAVVLLLPSALLGAAAIVLTIMARDEFEPRPA